MNTILAAVIAAVVSFIVSSISANEQKKTLIMTLRDSLDSKSGWREKLFDVAAKDKMTLSDIYLLRTALQINAKEGTINLQKLQEGELVKLMIYNLTGSKEEIELDKIKIFSSDGQKQLTIYKMNELTNSGKLDEMLCRTNVNEVMKIKVNDITVLLPEELKEHNNKTFDDMTNTMIKFCEKTVKVANERPLNSKKERILLNDESEKVRIYCRFLLKNHWEDLRNTDENGDKRKEYWNGFHKAVADTMDMINKIDKSVLK
ncbi:hypothetical protein ACVQ8P_03725 [Dellaglioa sp. BT-FLS60]